MAELLQTRLAAAERVSAERSHACAHHAQYAARNASTTCAAAHAARSPHLPKHTQPAHTTHSCVRPHTRTPAPPGRGPGAERAAGGASGGGRGGAAGGGAACVTRAAAPNQVGRALARGQEPEEVCVAGAGVCRELGRGCSSLVHQLPRAMPRHSAFAATHRITHTMHLGPSPCSCNLADKTTALEEAGIELLALRERAAKLDALQAAHDALASRLARRDADFELLLAEQRDTAGERDEARAAAAAAGTRAAEAAENQAALADQVRAKLAPALLLRPCHSLAACQHCVRQGRIAQRCQQGAAWQLPVATPQLRLHAAPTGCVAARAGVRAQQLCRGGRDGARRARGSAAGGTAAGRGGRGARGRGRGC